MSNDTALLLAVKEFVNNSLAERDRKIDELQKQIAAQEDVSRVLLRAAHERRQMLLRRRTELIDNAHRWLDAVMEGT